MKKRQEEGRESSDIRVAHTLVMHKLYCKGGKGKLTGDRSEAIGYDETEREGTLILGLVWMEVVITARSLREMWLEPDWLFKAL